MQRPTEEEIAKVEAWQEQQRKQRITDMLEKEYIDMREKESVSGKRHFVFSNEHVTADNPVFTRAALIGMMYQKERLRL